MCTENLNPGVVVMETAQNGKRSDAPGPLNHTRHRRIFIQRSGSRDSAQVGLAKHDDMIQALATDRPDQQPLWAG